MRLSRGMKRRGFMLMMLALIITAILPSPTDTSRKNPGMAPLSRMLVWAVFFGLVPTFMFWSMGAKGLQDNLLIFSLFSGIGAFAGIAFAGDRTKRMVVWAEMSQSAISNYFVGLGIGYIIVASLSGNFSDAVLTLALILWGHAIEFWLKVRNPAAESLEGQPPATTFMLSERVVNWGITGVASGMFLAVLA